MSDDYKSRVNAMVEKGREEARQREEVAQKERTAEQEHQRKENYARQVWNAKSGFLNQAVDSFNAEIRDAEWTLDPKFHGRDPAYLAWWIVNLLEGSEDSTSHVEVKVDILGDVTCKLSVRYEVEERKLTVDELDVQTLKHIFLELLELRNKRLNRRR